MLVNGSIKSCIVPFIYMHSGIVTLLINNQFETESGF